MYVLTRTLARRGKMIFVSQHMAVCTYMDGGEGCVQCVVVVAGVGGWLLRLCKVWLSNLERISGP